MNFTLAEKDFPLHAIGRAVYSATRQKPIFIAPSNILAEDLVRRLNRDWELSKQPDADE